MARERRVFLGTASRIARRARLTDSESPNAQGAGRRRVLKLSGLRERAGSLVRDNHYGWFDRVKTGYYDLSPKGREDLALWATALQDLKPR